MDTLVPVFIGIGCTFVAIGGMLLLLWRCYQRIPAGTALVVTKPSGSIVRRSGGAVVLPIVNQAEVIDLRVTPLRIERRNASAVLTRDDVRTDIGATFLVRVNDTADDILTVAKSVGCAQAAHKSALLSLFSAKFTSALVEVVRHMTFDELTEKRDVLQDQVIGVIGRHLNGFVLDDCSVDHVERTRSEHAGPFR